MTTSNKEYGFGLLGFVAVFTALSIVVLSGWYVSSKQDKGSEKEVASNASENTPIESDNSDDVAETEVTPEAEVESTLNPGSFAESDDSYLGDFEARGYIEIKELDEAFCESNCTKQKVAYFIINETANSNVQSYIESMEGNTFVDENSIAIGCVIDNKVTGRVVFSVADSTSLLATNTDNMLVLNFNRTIIPAGAGADNCWSHFDEISII